VQSLFFLAPSSTVRMATGLLSDPFEEAHRRAMALLERTGIS
jgi:hypothetical protein